MHIFYVQEELYSYVTVVDTEDFAGLGTKVHLAPTWLLGSVLCLALPRGRMASTSMRVTL